MEDGSKEANIMVQAGSASGGQTVTIAKSDVYGKVKREASYIGSKAVTAEDPGAYDRIHIGESDSDMLDILWLEGWTELTRSLRNYVSAAPTMGQDNVTVSLTLPEGADMAQLDIENSIVTYMKDAILFKWLTFTSSASATVYGNSIVAALGEIRAKLSGRKMTARENVKEEDDIQEDEGEVERTVETVDGTVSPRPVAIDRTVRNEDGTEEQEGEVERTVETVDGTVSPRPVAIDRKVRRAAAVSVKSGQCKRGVQHESADEITLSTINKNIENEEEI